MSDRKDDPAFIYFPSNYRWSMGLLLCLSAAPWGGAEIDEVNRVGRALRDKIGDDNAWFEEWARMGDIVEARGRDAAKKGHTLTAAACLMRAAHYYQTGERFLQHGPRSAEIYKKAVKSFADGAAMLKSPRIESVEVPYRRQDAAGAVRASGAGGGRQQARAGDGVLRRLRHHQGDSIFQGRARSGGARHRLPDRGRARQRRERALPRSAADRRDGKIRHRRLRVSGRAEGGRRQAHRRDGDFSLGGYYAPRAASLEPRYACCIAWGAQWDYYETWRKRFELLDNGTLPSLSVPPEHLMWVFGVKSRAEAMKKLEGFRLDGIVQKMTCPFLLVHGAGDEQIPLAVAEKCFAAVGSKDKTLKVFHREEGGFHHCQVDNVTIGTNYMWDWAADVLKPGT